MSESSMARCTFIAIGMCWASCGDDGRSAPAPIGTLQQVMPVADFMALVEADPALADALALGAEAIGELADSDGCATSPTTTIPTRAP